MGNREKFDLKNKPLGSFAFIQLLEKFTKKEINRFQKFLLSPYFNNHSTLIRLFCELKKYFPDFNQSDLTKEKLFKAVNGNKKFNAVVFRKYMSNLLKLAEDFVHYEEIANNRELKNINVLEQYSLRKATGLYNHKLKNLEKMMNQNEVIDEDYFHLIYKYENVKANYHVMNSNIEKAFPHMVDSIGSFISYFLFNASESFQRIQYHSIAYNVHNRKSSIENFFTNFEFKNFIKNENGFTKKQKLILELNYYEANLANDYSNISNYLKFKKQVLKCVKFLHKSLVYSFFIKLNSFCIALIYKGNSEIDRELFENFKYMLSNNLFIIKNRKIMNIFEYRTILLCSLRLKEFNWAENFITTYIDYLPPDSRENFLNYGFAHLLFAQQRFTDCLSKVSLIKPENFALKFDLKTLTAKLYFELDYFESAYSLIDTYYHFLKKGDVMSDYVRNNQMNFLRILKKMLKLKSNPDIFEINKLKSQIEKHTNINNKKWLLEKTNEIAFSCQVDNKNLSEKKFLMRTVNL